VILDNYRPHTTDKTLEKAAELGMILVNLPPYCPDLNPIEQLWRVLKRILSLLFNLTTDEVKRTIREIYRVLSVRTSFAEKWIDTYIE
jgi:transposase